MKLNCRGQILDLALPRIMGILNVTPDSFSDGGQFVNKETALAQARKMVAEGASIIDVGGESTRPGAEEVVVEQEIERVVPIIEAIHSEIDTIISIDTSKPQVMQEAVSAGASLINDVRALTVNNALDVAAKLAVPVCLMHAQGTPKTMQNNPQYHNVVTEVLDFLMARIDACESVGIKREQLIIDPGFGFGKKARHNLRLMKQLELFSKTGFPVLVGLSRKSIIGEVLKVSVEERLAGSLALASLAVWQGAKLIRTHDVRETYQAIQLTHHVTQVDNIG